jgi:hypothetical protein
MTKKKVSVTVTKPGDNIFQKMFCFVDEALENTLAYWNSDKRATLDMKIQVSE